MLTDMLHTQHLRCAGLEAVIFLGVFAFFAAKRWIRQNHIKRRGRRFKQRFISRRVRQRIAVP